MGLGKLDWLEREILFKKNLDSQSDRLIRGRDDFFTRNQQFSDKHVLIYVLKCQSKWSNQPMKRFFYVKTKVLNLHNQKKTKLENDH